MAAHGRDWPGPFCPLRCHTCPSLAALATPAGTSIGSTGPELASTRQHSSPTRHLLRAPSLGHVPVMTFPVRLYHPCLHCRSTPPCCHFPTSLCGNTIWLLIFVMCICCLTEADRIDRSRFDLSMPTLLHFSARLPRISCTLTAAAWPHSHTSAWNGTMCI